MVNHIETNFDAYKHALQQRLNCKEEEIDKLGKEFLANDLTANGIWGGSESLLAITEIFGTNILIFNENGPFYFAAGFKASIFLAYRERIKSNGEKEYYHYDSICEIGTDLLFKCATDSGGKMGNNTLSDSNVIEI